MAKFENSEDSRFVRFSGRRGTEAFVIHCQLITPQVIARRRKPRLLRDGRTGAIARPDRASAGTHCSYYGSHGDRQISRGGYARQVTASLEAYRPVGDPRMTAITQPPLPRVTS